jgi:beta-lactamase regulating signal transducer with metallopeptidase domain
MESLLSLGFSNAIAATVLALLAFVVDRTLRRPALSHCFWLLVLIKLITPPLVHVPLPRTADPAPTPTDVADNRPALTVRALPLPSEPSVIAAPSVSPAAEAADVTPVESEPRSAQIPGAAIVLGVWLAGALAWWTAAVIRISRFSRMLQLTKRAPAEVQERVRQLGALLGLRRFPEVVFVPGTMSPLLWAPGRQPRLLVPQALWQRFDDEQRDSLLVHELAHLRRRDHWVRRLELVVLGLYWWHPAAWWAQRELQDAEERCCDGWVARVLPGCWAAYATALVETVAFLSGARTAVPLGASGSGQARQLKRRVTMILDGKTARPLGWSALSVVVGIGVVLLALTPGSAEPPAPTDTRAMPARTDPPAAQKPPIAVRFSKAGDVVLDPPPSDPNPTFGPDPNQIIAAREEVELLEAQMEVKKARVDAAKVAVEGAQASLKRMETLYKSNVVTVEEIEKVRLELRTRQLDVHIREAELREPAVRLRQARRRLKALEGGPEEKKEVGPADAPRLDRMEKKVDELRREIESLRKELQRAGSGKTSASTGEPGHSEPMRTATPREQRMLRWTINFNTKNGEDYIRQLRGLGAFLAIPTDAENKNHKVIRNLNELPPKLLDEDLSKIERIFWIDDKPKSVESLARALRLTEKPAYIVVFLPQEIEDQLFQAEAKYRGLKENEILETHFEVRVVDGKGVPIVVDQKQK